MKENNIELCGNERQLLLLDVMTSFVFFYYFEYLKQKKKINKSRIPKTRGGSDTRIIRGITDMLPWGSNICESISILWRIFNYLLVMKNVVHLKKEQQQIKIKRRILNTSIIIDAMGWATHLNANTCKSCCDFFFFGFSFLLLFLSFCYYLFIIL